jgi:GT2 family glycosyltransferase
VSGRNPVCTVIVSARDRFSPTEGCLDNLFLATPEPVDVVVVLGGAPEALRERLRAKYAGRAEFLFEERFLNCAEARNLGLRAAKTKLAACLDNDVYPRAGWLAPLLRCQEETGAGLVVPLMLENSRTIHTAGNRLFITRKGGKEFASKVLPFYKHEVYEGTSLERQPSDYGEMHCQLVDAKAALALGVLDERVQEGEELDSGLAWRKGGRTIWFEPKSIVVYDFPLRIEDPGDIALFKWRWNIRNLIPGYRVMHAKWGMDMTEAGDFKYFLMRVNGVLGVLPRVWPTSAALAVDRLLGRLPLLAAIPGRAWSHLRAWSVGYYDWIEALEDSRPQSARIAGEILRSLPFRSSGRSGTASVRVSGDVRVDVYRREISEGRGPAASVFAGGREVLRLECFGDGKGHWHPAPERTPRWETGRVFFEERTVDGQIARTLRLLQDKLDALGIEPEAAARACERTGEKLRAISS